MVKKGPNQTNKTNIPEIEEAEIEALSGQFADSDNHTPEPEFSEELSDGGVRNKMAKEQLKQIRTD